MHPDPCRRERGAPCGFHEEPPRLGGGNVVETRVSTRAHRTIGGCTRVGCRQFGWGRNGGLTASVRIPVCAVRAESPGLPPAGGHLAAVRSGPAPGPRHNSGRR